MRMSYTDWMLLVLLSLLWGGAFFFAAVAVHALPPLTVVLARTGLASIALGLVVCLGSRGTGWALKAEAVPAFMIMGLLNNLLPFSLLFWAQTMIPSGLASILNATTPIFAIIAAHFLLADERMAPNKAIGIAFGFFGVVIIFGGNAFNGEGFAFAGMLACLCAACSYGLAGTYGRRFRSMGIPPVQVAFGQLLATTIMMIPLAALIEQPWTLVAPGVDVIASVVALALASTALAYVIYFRLLASAGAVNTALVTLLIPVSAIVLGAVFLGETLAARHYVGMALIGVGLLAIDGRIVQGLRR